MLLRHRISITTLVHCCCAGRLLLLMPIQNVHSQEQCADYAPPLIIQGKRIYNSVSGEYVPIKGVNYYPRPNAGSLVLTNSIDFTTEEFRPVWERDIVYLKQLNINLVRLYAVEPGRDHDGFMCALKSAGIYAMVGLAADCENCAITKDQSPTCYPPALKERGQFIINEYARYDNVLGFDAGNEISLSSRSVFVNGACQKQFIRDMRAYIQGCSETIRPIPIGLAIADTEREDNALWYSCRSDPNDELENAEYMGFNAYLHCDGGLADGEPLLGYETLLTDFASYDTQIPVLLTEFGCVDASFPNGQRDFRQVDLLYSERFRTEFAGGVVFEYSTEKINSKALYPFDAYGEGNFGLGYLAPEFCDDEGIPCQFTPFPQFSVLASKYGAVNAATEPLMGSTAIFEQLPPPICPAAFPTLQSYDWPTRTTPDRECPGKVSVTCPGIPDECQSGITRTGASATASANQTVVPTASPSTAAVNKQSFALSSASPTPGIGITIPSSQNPAGVTTFPPTVDVPDSGADTQHGIISRALPVVMVIGTLVFFV